MKVPELIKSNFIENVENIASNENERHEMSCHYCQLYDQYAHDLHLPYVKTLYCHSHSHTHTETHWFVLFGAHSAHRFFLRFAQEIKSRKNIKSKWDSHLMPKKDWEWFSKSLKRHSIGDSFQLFCIWVNFSFPPKIISFHNNLILTLKKLFGAFLLCRIQERRWSGTSWIDHLFLAMAVNIQKVMKKLLDFISSIRSLFIKCIILFSFTFSVCYGSRNQSQMC